MGSSSMPPGFEDGPLDEGLPFGDEPGSQSDDWAAEWDDEEPTNVSALPLGMQPVETALDAEDIIPAPGTLKAFLMHEFAEGEDVAHAIEPEVLKLRIGRGRTNEIQVATDGEISRNHARLLRRRNSFFLQDMGSTNGSIVDGQRISVIQLRGGEHIQLGLSRFSFVFMPTGEA